MDKVGEINRLIEQYAPNAKPETFTGYMDRIWRECIENSDEHVHTGKKPVKKDKKEEKKD